MREALIICDASPLILLAKIGALDLLPSPRIAWSSLARFGMKW
jgi:hypothetical protein